MKKVLCVLIAFLMTGVNSEPLRGTLQTENNWKITEALENVLGKLDDEDEVRIYALLYDLDEEAEMEKFMNLYPEEYEEYVNADEMDTGLQRQMLAMENPDYDETEYINPINGDLLRAAIAAKRSIYSEDYENMNRTFIDDYEISEELFVSRYSPMIIIAVTKAEVYHIATDERVYCLDLFVDGDGAPELALANTQSGAKKLRDEYNCKGHNIRIGLLEAVGVPDVNQSDLSGADIHILTNSAPVSSHATTVARIIVGSQNGIVPLATLYVACYNSNLLQFYNRTEDLLTAKVNIINMSGRVGESFGAYDFASMWVDHIAVRHNVHFVKSAGNRYYDYVNNAYVYNISSPGLAYNAITVGGFDDLNTSVLNDDTLCSFSCYLELASQGMPEKPNLVASATKIYLASSQCEDDDGNYNSNGNNTGTSFAAPQVTGVIAQLCCLNDDFLLKQSTIGAILEASAARKADGSNNSLGGSVFTSNSINSQISEKEGAGILSAEEARKVIHNGKYWKKTIQTSSFPYTQNVYISSANNSHIRVAIFWLKRNSYLSTQSDHVNDASNNLTQEPFSNLNLKVYAPDGTLMGSSTTLYSNYEIVQFDPTQTGYYRIVISKSGTNSSTKEFVGIAVW